MHLTSGYLPLPVVRLSRYIPATESKNGKLNILHIMPKYYVHYLICEQTYLISSKIINYNLKEKNITFTSKLYKFL